MSRLQIVTTRFQAVEVVEEEKPPEQVRVDDGACDHPDGHLFQTSCGATKCAHCGLVAWL